MKNKKSRATTNSENETRQFHEYYLRALNNPLRRRILLALNEGEATIEKLKAKTGLEETELKWHLSVLESGFCIERKISQEKVTYTLTQEGKVVNYIK